MVQYIDKAALVAEIDRRKELVDDPIILDNDLIIGERNAYIRLLSFINTLEVKEVDLEKEINTQWNKFVDSEGEVEQFSEIAKRFFELGMQVSNKAQKGEEV